MTAEQVLLSAGFAADHLQDRIPKRFLHPSKLRGIDFDYQRVLGKRLPTPDSLPNPISLRALSHTCTISAARSPDHQQARTPEPMRETSLSPTITGQHFFRYWISLQQKLLHDSPEIFMP